MSNPIFDRVDREARRGYAGFDAPQAPTYGDPTGYVTPAPAARPVSYDDVFSRAGMLFAIVLGVGAVSWFAAAQAPATGQALWLGGVVGTLILGLVIAFKKTISVPLIVGYAVLEGAFVGAASQVFNTLYDGVVPTAVLATVCVFIAMFAGWRSGIVKVTDKFRRMMTMAILGYALFALVNLVAALMGVGAGWGFGGSGPLGIAISVFATGLAAFTLALDFDSIDTAVRARMPQQYGWLLAHGLVVTVVWLYVEMLRLLSRLRD